VQLPAHDAHEIERYLAVLRHAGLHAQDVEIRKADLEDVFLEVMALHGDAPVPAESR
jgi:ABC-2 type transport system ATP-binding protein